MNQGLQLVVVVGSLQNQLHPHAKTRVRRLHHALGFELEALGANDDLHASARRKRCGHLHVASPGANVGQTATMGNPNTEAVNVGAQTAGMTGLLPAIAGRGA